MRPLGAPMRPLGAPVRALVAPMGGAVGASASLSIASTSVSMGSATTGGTGVGAGLGGGGSASPLSGCVRLNCARYGRQALAAGTGDGAGAACAKGAARGGERKRSGSSVPRRAHFDEAATHRVLVAWELHRDFVRAETRTRYLALLATHEAETLRDGFARSGEGDGVAHLEATRKHPESQRSGGRAPSGWAVGSCRVWKGLVLCGVSAMGEALQWGGGASRRP
jgi:hypothetical protein